MKVSATSALKTRVSGSSRMMVLCAAKPGIAPMTMPMKTAGTITHQSPREWKKSSDSPPRFSSMTASP